MEQIKTVFIQNIISPYRSRLFNCLAKELNSFAVYYMAEKEPDRSWDISRIAVLHPHWVDSHGSFINSKLYQGHWNPYLVKRVLSNKKIENVILGAGYADLTILLFILIKRLHLTSKKYFFWAEANYLNQFHKENRFKYLLRRFVFNTVDGAILYPGKMSLLSFQRWGIKEMDFIQLPNTIDDLSIVYTADNARINNDIPVFIFPARLIEKVKGIINFLRAIGDEVVRKCHFILAGDGPDEQLYRDYLTEHGLEKNVTIMGFCEPSQMCSLYNKCNAVILPSFTDSSPLSLVEGLKMHLPILCSNRCGNHYEVVEDGINGYVFDPYDKESIKEKFLLFLSRSKEWPMMGEISYSKYQETFDTHSVVDRFVSQFTSVCMGKD